MKTEDLIGRRFGRLIVKGLSHRDKHGKAHLSCACECGKSKSFNARHLLSGKTMSCGCLRKWLRKPRVCSKELWDLWFSMMRRCQSSQHKSWQRYGGRGISIHEGWSDISAFAAWAVANGYQRGSQLHRKDNDGNYEPNNCEWLKPKDHAAKHARRGKRFSSASASLLSFGT